MRSRLQQTLKRLTPQQRLNYLSAATRQFAIKTRDGKQRREWPAEKKIRFLEGISRREDLPEGKVRPVEIPSFKRLLESSKKGFFPVLVDGNESLIELNNEHGTLQGVYQLDKKVYALRHFTKGAECIAIEAVSPDGDYKYLGKISIPIKGDYMHFRKIEDFGLRGLGLGYEAWKKAEKQTILHEKSIDELKVDRGTEDATHFRAAMQNQGYVLKGEQWIKKRPYAFPAEDMEKYHAIEIISPNPKDAKRKTLFFPTEEELKRREEEMQQKMRSKK